MFRKRKVYFCLVALLLCSSFAKANPFDKLRQKGWEIEVRAGVNLGGVSPIPFPVEIRKIHKLNPKFNGQIGLIATNWLNKHWGLALGIGFEQKGMESLASVKDYQIEIAQQGNVLSGAWTGKVRSSYSASYVTLPIVLVYRFNSSIKVNAGLYAGYRFEGDFSGDVYDGYFRQGSSIGEKIDFGKETKTPYSFNEYLAPFEIGFEMGGSAQVFKRFQIFLDLKYGFNGIFKGNFKAFPFKMHPVYLGTGFGYRF